MIHTGSCTGLQLSIIPERAREWVAGFPNTLCLEQVTGNALLMPTRDLPHSERSEYRCVLGTRVEGYAPVLDVFFWQFARIWTGFPNEKCAYLAAPVEHVRGALASEIALVSCPESILQALPEDANIHWRSFSSEQKLSDDPQRSTFSLLLDLLQTAGVVVPKTEANERLLALCERLAIPMRQQPGAPRWSFLSADSFVWSPPNAQQATVAHLGTVFACWYGIDLEED